MDLSCAEIGLKATTTSSPQDGMAHVYYTFIGCGKNEVHLFGLLYHPHGALDKSVPHPGQIMEP